MIGAIVGDIAGSQFEWRSRLLLAVSLAVIAGCKYERSGESVTPSSNDWAELTALPCMAAPSNAKLLDEAGASAASWIAPHRDVSDAQRDAELFAIKASYENDCKEYVIAHSNVCMGGWYGVAMDRHHRKILEQPYHDMMNAWSLETAASPLEQRQIKEYAPTFTEALVPHARLMEKISVWNRIKCGLGCFKGQQIEFEDGIAAYRDSKDDKDGFSMKLRIDREFVWTTHGFDYAIAHSDAAAIIEDEIKGCSYGATDALRSSWFLRFRKGRLVDACQIGSGDWDNGKFIFYFVPSNNRLEVMNKATGDLEKELFLALWEHETTGGRRFYNFGTKEVEILDGANDCSRISVLQKSATPSTNEWVSLTALSCVAAPRDAELLDESGAFALYVGETAEDADSNKARDADPDRPCRNSLFLRCRKADGTDEWRVLMTSGSTWREVAGMSEWCSSQSSDLKDHFYLKDAKFASDRRHLWLVCNTDITLWDVVCSYDVKKDEFRVLIDGSSFEEQPDGTLLVQGKKSYPNPDDGLGAIWRDVWINSEGEIVRKGQITLRGADL